MKLDELRIDTDRAPREEPGASRERVRRWLESDPADAARWYVVLESEMHGPIGREELVELLADTTGSDDAPVWHAGLAEWLPVSEVDELASAIGAWRRGHAGCEHPHHAAGVLPFTSGCECGTCGSPTTSGCVDVGALLRAAGMTPASASESPPAPVAISIAPERVDRGRWAWLAGGVAIGAIAVGLVLAPYGDRAPAQARPAAAPPREIVPAGPVSRDVISGTASVASSELAALPGMVMRPEIVAAAEIVALPDVAAVPAIVTPPEVATPRDEVASREIAAPRRALGASAPVATVREARSTQVDPIGVPEPTTSSADARRERIEAPTTASFDDLLTAALPPPEPVPAVPAIAEPEAQPELAGPSRDDVTRALDGVRDAVAACGAQGVAHLRITVAGASGRVTSAYVDGALAGTPAGSCIARAVRGATFAPFERPTVAIHYPFAL